MRLRILLVVAAAAVLAACPKGILRPSTSKLPPGVRPFASAMPCTGDSQCDPSSIVCADPNVHVCRNGTCQFAVNQANTSCLCFQNDIQSCTVSCAAADPSCKTGVHQCTASGASAAAWGACVAPAGCPTDNTSRLCDTNDASCPRGTQTFTCASGWGACQKVSPCLNCGASGQPCCGNVACANGLSCQNGSCQPCGSNGQRCCPGSACGDALFCAANGLCEPQSACGEPGQMCCSGGACDNGSMCGSDGNCAQIPPCGGNGQACCQNGACASGLACANQICTTCGGSGQPCCDGGQCNANLTCQSGSCVAVPPPPPSCGNEGEACCASAPKCKTGLACESGRCARINTCGDCDTSYDKCISSCNGDAQCECLCDNNRCRCRQTKCGTHCTPVQC